MARQQTGSFKALALADGTFSFRLRFTAYGQRRDVFLHERPGCVCGCGGHWTEQAARTELGNIIAKVRVGIWKPGDPVAEPEQPQENPTFHVYASGWLQRKKDGVTSERPLAENTIKHYRNLLTHHLLPFFATYPLDEINRDLCLEFKARKLHESNELQAALAAGADLRDHRNRRLTPAGLPQIKAAISVLAMILDEAIEDELIDTNPARGKRMRIRPPKANRSFLEADELTDLLQAASALDALPQIPAHERAGDSTRARVARRLATGNRPSQIALELGLAKATVSFHTGRLGVADQVKYVGHRPVIEILARAGTRASELCALRWRDVRLHDPGGGRFHIRDAKTAAGIREVQMTPALVQALIEHRDRLHRAGHETGPDDHVIPNRRGGQLDRHRIAAIVHAVSQLATAKRAKRELPPLPHITPHSLRRTYISLALIANNYDVKWVMGQVGHADSKMTMDVYAQLEQRIPRQHGTNFDRLLDQADSQPATTVTTARAA